VFCFLPARASPKIFQVFFDQSVTKVKTDDIIVSRDVKNTFQLFHKQGGSK